MRNINRKELFHDIISMVIMVIIMFLVFSTVCLSTVRGESMDPTFSDSQKLVTLKTNLIVKNDFERGDIVISDGEDFGVSHIIKRVVGLPGETVELKNNKLYINDIELEEDYIKETMIDNEDGTWVLDDNEYFICGDNRNNSADSRVIGPVTYDEIVGKVIFDLKHFEAI